MSLQRADVLHASGVYDAASGNAYSNQGFTRFEHLGVGVYRLTCDEPIGALEAQLGVLFGVNEVLIATPEIITPGVVLVRVYDALRNPSDCVTLRVMVWQVQTGPVGVLPSPPIPSPIIPPGGPVLSVFGRVGVVIAMLNDYVASLIGNDSSVPGATVADALDTLAGAIPPPSPVSSVFGRVGAVIATLNDYVASLIGNDSSVAGATVADALDTLEAAIPSAGVPLMRGIRGLGAGNYYELPAATDLAGNAAGFEIVIAVILDITPAEGGQQALFSTFEFLVGGWRLGVNSARTVYDIIDGGGNDFGIFTGDWVPRGASRALAILSIGYDGANRFARENGKLFDSTPMTGYGVSTIAVRLGGNPDGTQPVTNGMTVVALGAKTNGVISASDWADQTRALLTTGDLINGSLTSRWSLKSLALGAAPATLVDLIGANTFTLTGAATVADDTPACEIAIA